MITPMIFRIRPVLAMSIILSRPVPKIMALGGVATGSIKAMDAARVAGIINSNGLSSILTERPARMGSIISVVAVFDVNSVKKVIMRAINAIIKMG